jgi:hypothetical protein
MRSSGAGASNRSITASTQNIHHEKLDTATTAVGVFGARAGRRHGIGVSSAATAITVSE